MSANVRQKLDMSSISISRPIRNSTVKNVKQTLSLSDHSNYIGALVERVKSKLRWKQIMLKVQNFLLLTM